VCDHDDFCCDTAAGFWDMGCADIASNDCESTCHCPTTSTCTGDCDGSADVQINELIICVNIALGADLSGCTACDGDGDGSVSISELILAVNAAQNGCP